MRVLTYYILDNRDNPVPVADVLDWAKWHSEHMHEDRVHMVTQLGQVRISTKFFGTAFDDLICLWETKVFIGGVPVQGLSRRVETWQEAYKLHKDIERLY